MSSNVSSIFKSSLKKLDNFERSELTDSLDRYRKVSDEWLKRQILENNRIDILCTEILGMEIKPLHRALQQFQFKHPHTLQLVFRGAGKCLKSGTPILMYDGALKKVEDVKIGDQLMGPDSEPRNVLSLDHGRDNLYKIVPVKGEPWSCNSNHILSLMGIGPYKGQIRDFSLREYVSLASNYEAGFDDIPWKQFRVGVNFLEKELPLDPYFFGLWLGGRDSAGSVLTNPEDEIQDWVVDNFDGKRIPSVFLINSRENRLKLLAGLLDANGWYDKKEKSFKITQKSEELSRQIAFLARSLGLAAYISKKVATIKDIDFKGDYWRVGISGDLVEIPCLVQRKKPERRECSKDVSVVRIGVEKDGFGEYYGFELDGDGRFLLSDFTVTHNTSVATIAKAIHLLLKDPNLRILVASRAQMKAESFLREIKNHFETNKRLAEVFGIYYDPKLVNKWDNREIDVLPRTKFTKEPSISTVGVEGSLVGKHFDVCLLDDIEEESSTLTQHMRDKTRSWYYQTLDPTLEPPDPEVPHRGELHIVGTRYHYEDSYGHLIENEMKNCHQIIPALNEKEQSPWPEKYPPEWFAEKRRKSGIIIFGAQYQCSTEAMKGEIFEYDLCQVIDADKIPNDLRIFMGIDLAISEKETADHFAIVVAGKDSNKNYYVLDHFDGQLRFNEQTRKIIQFYNKWEPIRTCIETNAYQAAQYQTLKDQHEGIRLKPVKTDKDKISRAWKLSAIFEDKRMFFKKTGNVHLLIEQLVLFPGHRYKDLFDALDLAIKASKLRKKRRRRTEPGII